MQRRTLAIASILGLVLISMGSTAWAQYQLTDLVSNNSGAALHSDPLLVNAWGLVHAPGSPWWISDNGSGWSTLYSVVGGAVSKVPLNVLIPTAGGDGPGSPTGIV